MKNEIPFYFIDEIVVRSPVYPFRNDLNEESIYSHLNDDFFLEAIYVASPLLHNEAVKLKDGHIKSEKEKNKILFSLHKYLMRMHTRSTPFGLFSTCGVGSWSKAGTSRSFSNDSFSRHTRIDMHVLHKVITQVLALPILTDYIKYYPNNSIYQIGAELRYMEYTFKNGFRQYRLSAVTHNKYISTILNVANNGLTVPDMIKVMINDCGVPEAESKQFVEDMISSQVLNSEFEVSLTNTADFTAQLEKHLTTLYQRSGSEQIRALSTLFRNITGEIHNLDYINDDKVVRYKHIVENLKLIAPSLQESNVFHIDAYRVSADINVNENIKPKLLDLFNYLRKINRGSTEVNDKLESFKRKFIDRYEYQTIPLMEVLDADFGIGYPIDKFVGGGSFVNDLPFKSEEKDAYLSLNGVEKWLLAILSDPNNKNASKIALEEQYHPDSGDNISWEGLPPTLSAMFRVLNDEKETINFEYFFGPSAASVLARFTHGNEEINSLVNKITTKEEDMMENCILAEIVHVPDNRITNVIMHPPFRKYEIPFLATPAMEKENVIGIQDLFVKIENNEIILFSKRLNKRIIPCKTHVHNHFGNTLPLYHFLGDLQNEGLNKRINFSWGTLTYLYLFLPRVTYKNIIVYPATWRLPLSAFMVETEDPEQLCIHVDEVRKLYAIPDQVLYAEGDNELFVDFKNPFALRVWLKAIQKKDTVVLKEFLWINRCDDQQYIHQYIATLISEKKKYFPIPSLGMDLYTEEITQRVFRQGSEWLYLKLYCGVTSFDLLLSNLISPLVKAVLKDGLVKKFFFIKYKDSDYHIRLRFNLGNPSDTGNLISMINTYIDQSKDRSLIYNISYDMYQREIERYGSNSIDICESIFYIDSIITLELLKVFRNDKENVMKSLWSMRMIDDFLTSCRISLEDKIKFADIARTGFSREFGTNKKTSEKVNLKYSTYKKMIVEIMKDDTEHTAIGQLLKSKTSMTNPLVEELMQLHIADKLEVNLFSLLSSVIHMMLNRLITHQERIHEFLIYEFLTKYYTTLKYMKVSDNKSSINKKDGIIE